jgi:hypothetical protein
MSVIWTDTKAEPSPASCSDSIDKINPSLDLPVPSETPSRSLVAGAWGVMGLGAGVGGRTDSSQRDNDTGPAPPVATKVNIEYW